MERFKDKNIRLWNLDSSIDVKCPNCNNKAVVKAKECPKCGGPNCLNEKVFECNYCYQSIARKVMYQPYAKVYCSGCSEKYEVTGKKSTREVTELKVRCPHCNHHEIVKPKLNEFEIQSTPEAKTITEPDFECSLWYQHHFKEEIFWALNMEHITYMESYISADLRERNSTSGYGGMTLVAKLPIFIKEAKNRVRLLKIIEKWKK